MNNVSRIKQRYQTTIPGEIRKKAALQIDTEIVWTYDEISGVIKVVKKPSSYTEYMSGLGKKLWQEIGGADRIKMERQKEKERLDSRRKGH